MHFIKSRRVAQLTILGLLLTTASCKDFYDVNIDPLNPIVATNAQLLPATQVGMATYLGFNIQGLGQGTSTLVGQLSSTRNVGAYMQTPDSFSGPWGGLYSDVLMNNEQIIRQATATNDWGYLGIAQIQKAYIFSIIVDMWGDVPYFEALQGVGKRTPKYDKGADIYADLFKLLDKGIENLGKGKALEPTTDIVYKGSLATWVRLATSLKLKLYNQIRKTKTTAEMAALVGPLLMSSTQMTEMAHDFEVDYGTSTEPENRNIGFLSDYANPGRENTIGRYFYEQPSTTGAGSGMGGDPRRPYYFYNQLSVSSTATSVDYIGTNNGNIINSNFVTVRLGSQGANRGANISEVVTLPGLYPIGGKFDPSNAGGGTASSASGNGTAPQRLYPYYASKFTEAELQLMVMANPAAAGTALTAAVQASFAKVSEVAVANGAPAITANQNTAYLTGVNNRYAAATTTEDRLRIIMTEKYKAGFGTGPDLYTDFRRTHYPVLRVPGQSAILPGVLGLGFLDDDDPETVSSGPWPRRLIYSQNDVLTNPNSPTFSKGKYPDFANPNENRVFWDVD